MNYLFLSSSIQLVRLEKDLKKAWHVTPCAHSIVNLVNILIINVMLPDI